MIYISRKVTVEMTRKNKNKQTALLLAAGKLHLWIPQRHQVYSCKTFTI